MFIMSVFVRLYCVGTDSENEGAQQSVLLFKVKF